MRTPRNPAIHLASAVAAVFVAGCGSDSSSAPELDEYAACLNVSFAQTTGVPLDQIAIGQLPSDFEGPVAAWIIGSDGGDDGFTPITVEESGDAFLTVPFHPSGSLDGGSIQLAVSDGFLRCEPVDFAIQALPEADGELDAIATGLRARLESVAGLLGTTAEEVMATEPGGLPPIQRPLAVALGVLENPDNPNSLAAILDGSSPASDPVGLELAARLLARTSVREVLDTPSDPAPVSGPGLVDDPVTECSPEYVGDDAVRLDSCMAFQRDVTVELASPTTEIADDLNSLIMLSQSVPFAPAQVVTRIVALLVYSFQQQDLQLAAALPSELGELNVVIPQTEWLEDELGPGTIETIEVTATSGAWSVGEAILDAFQTVSASLRLIDRFSDEEAVDDLGRYLVEDWLEEVLEDYDVEPQLFGPVDVSLPTYSDIEVDGTSIDFESHTVFTLESPGTSTVRIRTQDGAFGGQQRDHSEDVTVGEIGLTAAPQSVVLAPDEMASFVFTVFDAAFPEDADLYNAALLQGSASIQMDAAQSEALPENSATHTVTYVAPSTPNAERSDTIRVRHTGTQGARSGDAPPREAIAIVRFGLIRITTPTRCVDIGETPFPIDWEVPEEIEEPNLVWSSTVDGTISQDGVFTPPAEAGVVTITVAFADNETIKDEITFTVGGCTCSATVTLDGATDETDVVRAFLSADRTGIIGVGWSGIGVSGASVFAGTDPLTVQVIPFGETGSYEALGNGSMNGRPWYNPFLNDQVIVAPLTLVIEENTGSVVAGSVSGMVGTLGLAGPDPVAVPFSFSFYLQADPFYSDDDALRCIVEVSGP